jgi:sugar phosphate isomerase/epimerase
MAGSHVILSAFGDEIADDLATQLDVLQDLGIHHLEFRGAWGKNILDLNDDELSRAAALLAERGAGVSAIGSPIGKSDLSQPRAYEHARLERAIAAARALDTRLIRVFSFYTGSVSPAECREEVLERMAELAALASDAGMTLVHENEKEIYGDVPERCLEIMASVNSPALRMAFDPANFVQVGTRPMAEGWPLLAPWTTHVHIKDALFSGEVRPAGEGEGEVPALLAALAQRGYKGFLTLEPHLKIAGPMGGYSGEAGMRTATKALRGLLEALPDIRVA